MTEAAVPARGGPFAPLADVAGATLLVDVLGGGAELPVPAAGEVALVVEGDERALDPLDLAPLPDGRPRLVLLGDGALRLALEQTGWTVVHLAPADGDLVAVAHGAGCSPWSDVAALLEAGRRKAREETAWWAQVVERTGGEGAVDAVARADAATEALTTVQASLATATAERDALAAQLDAQSAEVARLVQESWQLKQRLVDPEGSVSPRVAHLVAQARRVRRGVQRRLARGA